MLVEHVMASPVIAVGPASSLADAARLMIEHRVSGLPVIDEAERLVGMVSEADLLHRAELGTARRDRGWLSAFADSGSSAQSYVEANTRRVDEVMTRTVHTIGADDWLDDAVRSMEQHGVKRLPVLRDGVVVGMLTRADLVRALSGLLAEDRAGRPASDRQIEAELGAELSTQDWVPDGLQIAVRSGVVTLRGHVDDARQRSALRAAAERIPGVRRVRDELTGAGARPEGRPPGRLRQGAGT